jgi:hypothetical protein
VWVPIGVRQTKVDAINLSTMERKSQPQHVSAKRSARLAGR